MVANGPSHDNLSAERRLESAKRPRATPSEPAIQRRKPHDNSTPGDRKSLLEERKRLPVWNVRGRLLEEVEANPILIIVGETGSGKTTQIPQFLYHSSIARGGCIACTQPRRVAAMTVAHRVAREMGTRVGELVGYSVRFDDKTSQRTRIKYMTDGMLLREATLDPLLQKYRVVVVDEAHERTVSSDILLGLLKALQKRRKADFRLIIMSATLDTDKFTTYYNGAKAVHIQGRTFPVQVLYASSALESYVDAALHASLQIHVDEPPGDVLVFLTGQEEIESLHNLLESRVQQLQEPAALQLAVLPLYAALAPEQQLKVFEPAPPGHRKVVLATNIAETSLTISGVRYVIDTGFVKSRGFNARYGFDSLQVVPVSQAQARQRSGRAGREAPGKAFRLFTEAAFSQLPEATVPEIQRCNLSSVVLQMKAVGIDDVLSFDFIDAPPRAAIVRSLELLLALGALDGCGQLSDPLGKQMARLPVDPMYAKVLLTAASMRCSDEALAVVAMVSTDSVFVAPRTKHRAARQAHRKFTSPAGDQLTLLAVFRMYMEIAPKLRQEWCIENFVNARSMRKALDIHKQLRGHLLQLRLPLLSCGDDSDPLLRALTAGLFCNAARKQLDGSYQVLHTGQTVGIHPSSVLHQQKPDFIVFDELVLTAKRYARNVSAIDGLWLPELAPAAFSQRTAQQGASASNGAAQHLGSPS